jgi:hypothetical protein
MKRDNLFDKFITTYFDSLWTNNAYLAFAGKNLDLLFDIRKQWNKNMEMLLAIFQLPNQQMQQKILHTLNTILAEWRFEQEELKYRLEALENEIKELKIKN